jgi:hypothetical protein
MQPVQASPFSTTATSGSLLPDPTDELCSGDLGEEMAALDVQNGEVERRTADEQRETEEAAEAQADAAEVQAMHDEASSMRAQGVFDGVVSIASSAAKAYCPAAGAAIDAGEKVGDGFWHAAQHDDEANAAAQKAAANQADNAIKTAAGAVDDANAAIAAALDFDRNYTTTEAQAQLAALHRV